MEEIQSKNSLKKFLDRLQEDSWQLELLVSGFAIFGLFYAMDPISNAFERAAYEDHILKDLYQTVFIAINILALNLVIHIVLRSLWIGALGLRSVSGDVEIEKLNYSKRFSDYLKKHVCSFDTYIENLEKLCSIIFAISFLLIFYVAAVFLVQHAINAIGAIDIGDASILAKAFKYLILGFLIIGALLTMIDNITLGLLKKNKWVTKIYFPFYWIFSYLTLSFLYRPLYYNFLDNKFGRRVSLFLLPFYLSVLFVSTLYTEQSGFVNLYTMSSNEFRANSKNYEDLVVKNNLFISVIAIQSKVITDPFIKVKVPLTRAIEDRIVSFNESLKPFQDENRFKSHMDINGNTIESSFKGNRDSLHREFLQTFQRIYHLKIDSVLYNPKFVISNESDGKNLDIGFEAYIGTSNLAEGEHVLTFYRNKNPDTDSIVTIREIPFWYYKE